MSSLKNSEDNGSLNSTKDCPPISTRIEDLVASGRYKVASENTLEMMKSIQQPNTISSSLTKNLSYTATPIKDMRTYITEQEGLNIGKSREKALNQHWRFYMTCEPIQRGIDAGIILGSCVAAFSARKPQNRIPVKLGFFWLAGFTLGMFSVPLLVTFADSLNLKRIKKLEEELFLRQRKEFYKQES